MEKPHTRPTPTARSAISSTASGTSGRCWYSTTSIRAGACVFRKSTAGRPTSRRRCSHRHSASWNRTGCCRARSTPRCRPAWNMRSRPAASRSCPTSQRLLDGRRRISTLSSKTGNGKRYSDGQGPPGKSSGYPRTAPCRQPTAKTLSADSKIRTLPQRATGNAHPRNRAPRKQDSGSQSPPGNAPAKASAGGNEIGIRHIPSTKKVPSGTFPILPFHRHRLRAVRCRTPDRNP